ncbi:MAG TPA: GNAT family N-acetyltransferase [Gemmatimonadales bacterium]|nr:GNAT family N-acetyltransferase [Gemmatimonadales bacterium]
MTAVPQLLDGRATVDEVGRVVREAFADYPVMRYVLGEGGDYAARLHTLIGFFHGARVLRDDAILGVYIEKELRGTALCSLPDRVPPPELDRLRERTWTELGPEARARYDSCVRAWEPVGVPESNVHVNMLAVPPRYQGRGLGRVLLERVHAISRERADSCGVTLTTETEANVSLYRHLGYEIVGRRTIAPGLETWGLFRAD